MTHPIVTLYGLTSCDSCRKARHWLAEHGMAVRFHDFRQQGLPADRLRQWLDLLGWQQVLNRRSATWRQLDETARNAVVDIDSAAALLLAHPTAIKRPVVEWSQGEPTVTLGFTPEQWQARRPG